MKRQTKLKHSPSKPIAGQPPCRFAKKRLFGTYHSKPRSGLRIPRLFSWGGIALEADWAQRHISTCSRCQQRFAALAKVQVGLSLLKSQVHSLDLLGRANAKTVAVLHRDLRNAPKAQHLRHASPRPLLRDRIRLYRQAFSQIAACFALLTLSKIGLFSSLEKAQKHGCTAMKHYYSQHIDEDMTDDLFTGHA